MSIPSKDVTLTRYQLTTTTQKSEITTPTSLSQSVCVQLHDLEHKRTEKVTSVPMHIIQTYLPSLVGRVQQSPTNKECPLPICIRNFDHVDDIEKPALLSFFNHLCGMSELHQAWFCLPAADTLAKGFLLYRALRLLDLNEVAHALRFRLIYDLGAQPLVSEDVQCLWWGFQYMNEWSEWLEALLANLVRFRIGKDTKENEYVWEFIENEMCQLTLVEQKHIESMFNEVKVALHRQSILKKARTLIKRAKETLTKPCRDEAVAGNPALRNVPSEDLMSVD